MLDSYQSYSAVQLLGKYKQNLILFYDLSSSRGGVYSSITSIVHRCHVYSITPIVPTKQQHESLGLFVGILHGFGFGQSKFMWSLRMLPKIKAVYSAGSLEHSQSTEL